MCHSVEMYLPKVTRDAAEHRLGAADFAAAERERRLVDLAVFPFAWAWRLVTGAGQAGPGGEAVKARSR